LPPRARLSADSLTLDLANSVPETGVDLTKQDLGDLTAVVVEADGKTVLAKLGTFGYASYMREAYDATAGIVVLKIDPAAAKTAISADIQLRQKDGTVLLAETALRAIATVPNIYLDEGERAALEVMVFDRGSPAGGGIAVAMTDFTSSTGSSVTHQTNAQGSATFPLTGTAGQVEGYMLVPGNGAPNPQFSQQINTYVYIRTWPSDDNIAQLPPTWANVHKFVLQNWQAMAPCMDNWLDLGDPDQVKSFAALLRKLTDKANFESFRFMPVTRDMTAGERALLYAFLDGTRVVAAAGATSREPSVRQMSRALRGG
jgi:hypothetical protein